jgi:hypothetical protein
MRRREYETVGAVVRERRTDRDSVVSSANPAKAYALMVETAERLSTALYDCSDDLRCQRRKLVNAADASASQNDPCGLDRSRSSRLFGPIADLEPLLLLTH